MLPRGRESISIAPARGPAELRARQRSPPADRRDRYHAEVHAMKIALLFDGLSALGKTPEVQLLDSIEAVESALFDWATEVVRVPVSNDGRWVERVRKGKFDLIFNLVEAIDGEAVYEPMVISVLELLGIPFTGSSSWTTALTLRENLVHPVPSRA